MRYYPILRGRMNELMAIRELAEDRRLHNVCPIIEPVKANPTLKKTLEELSKNEVMAYFVNNPQVGTYEADVTGNRELREGIEALVAESSIGRCMILAGPGEDDWLSDPPDLVLFTNENAWECERAAIGDRDVAFQIVSPLSISFLMASGNKIRLKDEFHRCSRNADYRKIQEEPFFTDYSDIRQFNFEGFSDYSIVGSEYAEGGFMPRAVAAHIVFPVEGEQKCAIRHFVSDERKDADRDTAGKYGEVVSQISAWLTCHNIEEMQTLGMQHLLDTVERGAFPGLGMLKRFTIMHHLELMGKLLDKWQ